MKVLKRWLLADELKKTYNYGFIKRVKYFWRMGWTQIPESMVGLHLGLIGAGILFWIAKDVYYNPPLPKYLEDYVVYRPDDPRVQKIRKTSFMDKP